MANLQQICIEGFCSDVPEYRAGDHIRITGDDIRTIAADLSNYYSKTEVDALINAVEVGEFVIVQSLPETGNPRDIYLVPKQDGGYTEHIYIEGDGWEQIGDTNVDLSNYYTKSQTDDLLNAKQNTLTAGNNIQISGDTISATDTKYTAGENISIINNVISAIDTKYEFPVVHVTSIEQLNAIDYPCMIYGSVFIPEMGYTGYDWNGIVIPTPGQISQFIDMGGESWIRANDTLASDGWMARPQTYAAGTNVQINGRTISATDTKYTASNATPLMDGTATPGTSASYAREGHRHPTDTTRAPLASPAFTGTPTAPTNGTASTSNTQVATTAFVQNAINRRLPKANTSFFSSTTAVSAANNTVTTWNLWTAPAAGTIIGYMHAAFAPNATGIRELQTRVNNTGIGNRIRMAAGTNGEVTIAVPVVRHLASGNIVQMAVNQTSGANLNVTTRYFNGIWIPD